MKPVSQLGRPLLLIVGGACVFWLPWYVPTRSDVVGLSAKLGFANLAAVVAVWGTALFYSVTLPSERARLDCFAAGITLRVIDVLLVAASTAVLGVVTVHVFEAPLTSYWLESGYFLPRIDRLLLGDRPYVDFQFNYGPLLLYPPLWLHRLTAGALSLERSYAVCLILHYALGFAALLLVVRSLRWSGARGFLVVALCVAPWFGFLSGANYTPLRFYAPAAALTLVISTSQSRTLLWRLLSTCAGTTLCFGLSVEMGVAFVAGLLGAALVHGLRREWSVALCLALVPVIVTLGWATIAPGYADGLLGFSSGAHNFPVFPSFQNMLFVLVIVTLVGPMTLEGVRSADHPYAPRATALGVSALVLVAPALGRNDVGHVLYNGAVAIALGLAHLRVGSRFAIGALAFLTTSVAWLAVDYPTIAATDIQRLAVSEHAAMRGAGLSTTGDAWAAASANTPFVGAWSTTPPFPLPLAQLEPGTVCAPLGASVALSRFVVLQPRPPAGLAFFPPATPEIHTASDLSRAIQETLSCRYVVMRASLELAVSPTYLAGYRRQWLERLTLFPVPEMKFRSKLEPSVALFNVVARRSRRLGVFQSDGPYVVFEPLRDQPTTTQ